MRHYELTYLISPKLSGEETKILSEKINSLIQEEGGFINKAMVFKKSPVYAKKAEGVFEMSSLSFYIDPGKLELFKVKLKANPQIFRYLLLEQKILKTTSSYRRKPLKKSSIKIVKKFKPKVELKEIEKKLKEILGE